MTDHKTIIELKKLYKLTKANKVKSCYLFLEAVKDLGFPVYREQADRIVQIARLYLDDENRDIRAAAQYITLAN